MKFKKKYDLENLVMEGYRPSEPDSRDFTLTTLGFARTSMLETVEVDMPIPVKNQENTGMCTAYASAVIASIINAVVDEETGEVYYPDFIPGDLYANKPTVREGESLRNIAKTLYKHGIAPFNVYGEEFRGTLEECQAVYRKHKSISDFQAKIGRISHYYRIKTRQDLVATLKMGKPVLLAVMVHENFIPDAEGKIPMPDGKVLAGHAIAGRAYDVETDMVLIRNSWGEEWGMDGEAWIPFDMIVEMYGFVDFNTEVKSIYFKIGLPMYTKNGQRIDMTGKDANGNIVPVAPFLKDGRTWVPLRYASEALDCEVEWLPNGQVIYIKQ